MNTVKLTNDKQPILRIALQKSGRLTEQSLELLKDCGIQLPVGGRKLVAPASNFPMEVYFLRSSDIPAYVADGVADVGILGENVLLEKEVTVDTILPLGFAQCRLSLAIPKGETYTGVEYWQDKEIATSYPNTLRRFLTENKVTANVQMISGSVEIAPSIGLADGVCDLVSSGSTLLSNGLKEVAIILESEAVLVANKDLAVPKKALLEQLIFRMRANQAAANNKYILLNAPNDKVATISALLPGMKSPSIMPLGDSGWSSLHSVVKETAFWERIDALKAAGAEGILVLPIEKMIV
ncbi:MAG: ATP phosphoribosyltransferase [Aureispira sp.]